MGAHISSESFCDTKDGVFGCFFSSFGLVRIRFPGSDQAEARTSTELPEGASKVVGKWIELTHAAIHLILRGGVVENLPPLDLHGTDFQRQVWAALLTISSGETRTYGDIARQIGNADSVRAVGRACGANPIPLIVPCHRVLASGNRLGGFSGGLGWKPKLLEREGWASGKDLPLFQDRHQADSP